MEINIKSYKIGFEEACEMIKKVIERELGDLEKSDLDYPAKYLCDKIDELNPKELKL